MQTYDTTRFVARVCKRCGKNFLQPTRFAKPGHGLFCELDCMQKWRKENAGTVRHCLHCGAEFRRRPYRDDVYCSSQHAAAARRVDLETRFWAKVNKTEGCWLWTGATHDFGYGKIYVDGVPRDAHRVCWEMYRGAIPEGLWVLHNCPGGDDPRCVRLDHLYLGTPSQNTQDCIRKGRFRARGKAGETIRQPRVMKGIQRGESHCHAKLTECQVREIRAAWSTGGVTQPALAARYGVSQATINEVVLWKTWRHLR